MKTPKRAVVSKKLSDEEKLNASRWTAFIKASGYSFRELTDEWLDFSQRKLIHYQLAQNLFG